MLASGFPTKIVLPFANNATPGTYTRAIPVGSQIGIQPGAASFTDGFPPLTFLNPSAGGALIDGRDINGILNELSALLMYYSAGLQVTYDSTFQTNVGGYPKGAIVQSATTPFLYWLSLVDNNATNPDTGGAGWVNAYQPPAGSIIAMASGNVPTGYLQCPTAQTNISRATYPALFNAIGTTWGNGDGSTTFGMPWFAAGYTLLHNTSGVGSATTGANISHSHTGLDGHAHSFTTNTTSIAHNHYATWAGAGVTYMSGAGQYTSYSGNDGGASSYALFSTSNVPNTTVTSGMTANDPHQHSGSTAAAGSAGASGSSFNQAAGTQVMYCVKY